MLLDVYGHYMPDETAGNADALAALDGPGDRRAPGVGASDEPNPRRSKRKMEPTIRLERTTCSLRDDDEGEE